MRIGIFGGSFDPVHNDHVAICEKFYKNLKLDKVLVVPAGQSPFKSGYFANAEQRKKMLELAFCDMPFVEISDYEINLEGKSYTYNTVNYFKSQYPNDQLFLLIGLDSFACFLSWKNPEQILKNCDLAVIYREGFDFEKEEQNFFKVTKKSISKLFHNGKASSTYIREQLKLGIYNFDFLSPKVCSFIKENNLYMGDELYLEVIKKVKNQKRLFHIAGVIATAIGYAKKLGESVDNARIASLLHDVAKYLNPLDYPNCIIPPNAPNSVKHQFLGAYLAREELGVQDENVLNAICYHTTGRPNMSTLEKIVFLADLLEPSRDYEEVDYLRNLVNQDFEMGFKKCLERLVVHLENNGQDMFDLTLKANNYYNKK